MSPRRLAAILSLVLAVTPLGVTASGSVRLAPDNWQSVRDRIMGAEVLDASCCKVCSKGKACGDSCISRDKTCRKGQGCACDG